MFLFIVWCGICLCVCVKLIKLCTLRFVVLPETGSTVRIPFFVFTPVLQALTVSLIELPMSHVPKSGSLSQVNKFECVYLQLVFWPLMVVAQQWLVFKQDSVHKCLNCLFVDVLQH